MENSTEFDLWNDTSIMGNLNVSATSTMFSNVSIRQQEIDKYALYLYGNFYNINFPITLAVCLVGLVTNFFNVIVFTRKHMMNSVNFFLMALSVADILIILTSLHYSVHHLAGFRFIFNYHYTLFYVFLTFLEKFNGMVCNWLVVAIGVWRLIAIKYPLSTNQLCSMSRAKKVLLTIVLLSLIFSLPVFVVLTYAESPKPFGVIYFKGLTKIAKENPKLFLLFWVLMSLVAFVPCVVLIIVTALLIKSLVQITFQRKLSFANNSTRINIQEDQSNRITAMLIILLILFVLNNLPDATLVLTAVLTALDKKVYKSSKEATDILRIFSMVNNSFSFFIYFFMGEQFRKTFVKLFCPCCKAGDISSLSSSETNDSNVSRRLSNLSSNSANISLSQLPTGDNVTQSTITINTVA